MRTRLRPPPKTRCVLPALGVLFFATVSIYIDRSCTLRNRGRLTLPFSLTLRFLRWDRSGWKSRADRRSRLCYAASCGARMGAVVVSEALRCMRNCKNKPIKWWKIKGFSYSGWALTNPPYGELFARAGGALDTPRNRFTKRSQIVRMNAEHFKIAAISRRREMTKQSHCGITSRS
jgi:hypothetical protein